MPTKTLTIILLDKLSALAFYAFVDGITNKIPEHKLLFTNTSFACLNY